LRPLQSFKLQKQTFAMLRQLTFTFFLLTPAAFAQELAPRVSLQVDQVRAVALPNSNAQSTIFGPVLPQVAEHRLIVKFRDALRARADASGQLVALSAESLDAVDELITGLGTTLRFSPLLKSSPSVLADLEARAAARSGQVQADLAGMMIVELESNSTAEMERVGQALNASPDVEWAWVELTNAAPPGDIAPTTPNLENFQDYRDPNPGLDVTYAWSVGARGQNVRLSDCEYGWDPAHEDMNDVSLNMEPGQTIPPFVFQNNWDDHGTAALGEVAAQDNGYGCSGIAPDAQFYTWPEYSVEQGSRRVTCITNAIAASGVGDVVMLEMQTSTTGSGYGPAELNPAVWTVCSTGTAAGVIVVAAAGNGNQNLDSTSYSTYQSWGDSGAIIVGAGSASAAHSKLSFSSYGSRVNVQGWGTGVFTLGYGSFNSYGGDPHQSYASGFGGTSSATPFIAGSSAALQSYILAQGGIALSSTEMRDLLISTGIAQGSGGHIGPFPDLRAAIDSLNTCPPPQSYCGTSPNSLGAGALLTWSGSTSLTANNAVISVESAASSVFGLFFYGAAETSSTLGDGQLCVAGGGQGLIRLNPTQQTDLIGAAQATLDFTQPPFSSGPGQVFVGQTTRWQYWYRDPAAGGAGFNLSDALRVTYCP
jgi:hypothetical protein